MFPHRGVERAHRTRAKLLSKRVRQHRVATSVGELSKLFVRISFICGRGDGRRGYITVRLLGRDVVSTTGPNFRGGEPEGRELRGSSVCPWFAPAREQIRSGQRRDVNACSLGVQVVEVVSVGNRGAFKIVDLLYFCMKRSDQSRGARRGERVV